MSHGETRGAIEHCGQRMTVRGSYLRHDEEAGVKHLRVHLHCDVCKAQGTLRVASPAPVAPYALEEPR